MGVGKGAAVVARGASQGPAAWGLTFARGYAVQRQSTQNMKIYKPTTPGFRGRIVTARTTLWKGRPLKALTKGLRKSGGRNNQGRISVWHRGGGHKRLYRMIDFNRGRAVQVDSIKIRLESFSGFSA
jgi:hypothetical protein